MSGLVYKSIEQELVLTLPELKSAYDEYIRQEGPPGEHAGAYPLFWGVPKPYAAILLTMPKSPGRNRLLKRLFHFVDQMLCAKDRDVRDLAFLEMYDIGSFWWYPRAAPFLGPVAIAELDLYRPEWRTYIAPQTIPDEDLNDIYGVRYSIANELAHEGITMSDIPGITSVESLENFRSLQTAKQNPDGVVFLSGYGTTYPYVISPAADVFCNEAILTRLVRDLATITHPKNPYEPEHTSVLFVRLPLGEKVWNLTTQGEKHARYPGKICIAEQLVALDLEQKIKTILNGKLNSLNKI